MSVHPFPQAASSLPVAAAEALLDTLMQPRRRMVSTVVDPHAADTQVTDGQVADTQATDAQVANAQSVVHLSVGEAVTLAFAGDSVHVTGPLAPLFEAGSLLRPSHAAEKAVEYTVRHRWFAALWSHDVDKAAVRKQAHAYAMARIRDDAYLDCANPHAVETSIWRAFRGGLSAQVRRAAFAMYGPACTLAQLRGCAREGAKLNEAGALAALYRLVPEAEDLARVRRVLQAQGLTSRAWRWLAQQPVGRVLALTDGPLSHLPDEPLGESDIELPAVEIDATPIIAACNLLAECEPKCERKCEPEFEPTPMLLLRALSWPPVRRWLQTALPDTRNVRFMRLIVREAARLAQLPNGKARFAAYLRDDLPYLMDWWVAVHAAIGESHAPVALEPNATYASLVRRQHDWHRDMVERDPSQMLTWASALTTLEIGQVRAQPLTDSWMLAREGMDMRHCVASYAKDCVADSVRIFALEHLPDGERATAELRYRAGHWLAGQVKGVANAEPAPALATAAQLLAQRYTRADRMASGAGT
jgi:hypothetical protein